MDAIEVIDADGKCIPLSSNNLYASIQSQEDVTCFIRVIESLANSKDEEKPVSREALQLLWVIVAFLRFACNPEDFTLVSIQKILSEACSPASDRNLRTTFDIMVEDLLDPSAMFIKKQYAYFKYRVFGTYSGFYGRVVRECRCIFSSISEDDIIHFYNESKKTTNEQDLRDDQSLFGMLINESEGVLDISSQEELDTSVHEAGHAVVYYLFDIDIDGVTIVPADNSSGRVQAVQKRILDFEERAIALFAGDAAEEALVNLRPYRVSACSRDFQLATSFVKDAVVSRIQNSVGLQEYVFIDADELGLQSGEGPYVIYETIRRCVELREAAAQLIRENRDLVEALAWELLEKKSMAGEDVKAFLDQCCKIREARVSQKS